MMALADDIAIEPRRPDATEAAALIAQAEAELALRYPPEDRHGLAVEGLLAQDARFFVAFHDHLPAGCGGYVLGPDGTAELKRMYVAPRHRGHGIARLVLAAIEAAAKSEGVIMLYLETGTLQAEAMALYRSAGYHMRGPFGAYRESDVSVFMEKSL
jgi:putative acetyltransferase